MKNFISEYKDIAEFTFLEGLYALDIEPLPKFVKMGFKGSKLGDKKLLPGVTEDKMPKSDFHYHSWFKIS